MAAVDLFVILAECQFEKGGYQNRFKLKGQWYTMSVRRGFGKIAEKQYANPEEDWMAIKRKLPQYESILRHFDQDIGWGLAYTNIQIIKGLALLLGIKTTIVRPPDVGLVATERLVKLCQHYGADTYLAGRSGSKYLDLALFTKAGIKVEFQEPAKLDQRHSLEVINAV